MNFPDRKAMGQPITAEDWNTMTDYLRAVTLRPSAHINPHVTPSGTTALVNFPPLSTLRPQPSALTPFQLITYRDPTTPVANTYRVHYGQVDNLHPDNDDSAAAPLTVTVANETTEFFWLEQTWGIVDDLWQPTALTIHHGETQWSGYPAQPVPTPGNVGTPPAPPSTFYILIGNIVVDASGKATVNQGLTNSCTTAFSMAITGDDLTGLIYTLQIGRTS